MWRSLRNSVWARRAAGWLLGAYITLVWKTSRLTVVPQDAYQRFESELPFILTFWHGQQFLISYVPPAHWRGVGLFSRHGDAEINATAVRMHGRPTIRGSGDRSGQFVRKGAIRATRQMLTALKDGWGLALTADVPKVARVASKGLIGLARLSGRPIVPIAIASTRRVVANSWDRAHILLPFGHVYAVFGELIRVEQSADDATVESARALVERQLNEISARAEALAAPSAGKAADAG
jgi:lysophospholipid acyltransferase (LPLAT)-like uncharacterized protein